MSFWSVSLKFRRPQKCFLMNWRSNLHSMGWSRTITTNLWTLRKTHSTCHKVILSTNKTETISSKRANNPLLPLPIPMPPLLEDNLSNLLPELMLTKLQDKNHKPIKTYLINLKWDSQISNIMLITDNSNTIIKTKTILMMMTMNLKLLRISNPRRRSSLILIKLIPPLLPLIKYSSNWVWAEGRPLTNNKTHTNRLRK